MSLCVWVWLGDTKRWYIRAHVFNDGIILPLVVRFLHTCTRHPSDVRRTAAPSGRINVFFDRRHFIPFLRYFIFIVLLCVAIVSCLFFFDFICFCSHNIPSPRLTPMPMTQSSTMSTTVVSFLKIYLFDARRRSRIIERVTTTARKNMAGKYDVHCFLVQSFSRYLSLLVRHCRFIFISFDFVAQTEAIDILVCRSFLICAAMHIVLATTEHRAANEIAVKYDSFVILRLPWHKRIIWYLVPHPSPFNQQ